MPDNENTLEIYDKNHPYHSRSTPEYKTFAAEWRNKELSAEERKKARLTYKRYELLTYESDKSASLYEIAGFIELKYRFWRQGRYVPSQQELDAIAAFYNIDPLYFDTGILPYISKSAEYNEFKANRIKLYPND